MGNRNLRESCAQVNLPSEIWQVCILIRHLITSIGGPPNTIVQVISLIFHIHWYCPHGYHLPSPFLSFWWVTLPWSQNRKLCHPSLALDAMIMTWHCVQHTPSTVSTQDCLSSLHFQDYELKPECRFSFWRAILHYRPPSASSPWEFSGWVNWLMKIAQASGELFIEHLTVLVQSCSIMASMHAYSIWHGYYLPVPLHSYLIMASRCIFRLGQLWPASSHYHGLQVHHLTRSMMPSRGISPRSIDHSLHMHLQSCPIVACTCISNLVWSWPPSVSPDSLDYSLHVDMIMASKCILKLGWSWSWSASRCSLDYRIKLSLQRCSITASKSISKLARSQPRGVSQSSLDHDFQVLLELLSNSTCSQSGYTVCRWVAI